MDVTPQQSEGHDMRAAPKPRPPVIYREIPASELRAGMQTYIELTGGKIKPDVKLLRPFLTSFRFPYLAWETTEHFKVVYSPCSKVLVRNL